jgi:hypothetical protein
MVLRDIGTMDASANTWPDCMSAVTDELHRASIQEADVISLQYEYDDAGVTARVFYWK